MSGRMTLGIDIGTTNVKACVFDTETNKVVGIRVSRAPAFPSQARLCRTGREQLLECRGLLDPPVHIPYRSCR